VVPFILLFFSLSYLFLIFFLFSQLLFVGSCGTTHYYVSLLYLLCLRGKVTIRTVTALTAPDKNANTKKNTQRSRRFLFFLKITVFVVGVCCRGTVIQLVLSSGITEDFIKLCRRFLFLRKTKAKSLSPLFVIGVCVNTRGTSRLARMDKFLSKVATCVFN
jgi:hypothetical protein